MRRFISFGRHSSFQVTSSANCSLYVMHILLATIVSRCQRIPGNRHKHCFLYESRRHRILETEDGLVFSRDAYGSIDDATTLDEVEDYIKAMLESSGSQEAK